MAKEVVVCEVLCFLRNNFDKLPISQLKPVLVNFYKDEDLFTAKELLNKAVLRAVKDTGGEPEVPRLPKRQGDNKGKQTAEDLLKLFSIVDERKLSEALPRFTADDLSKIPFMNADSGSVLTMAKTIESLEHRMRGVEQMLMRLTSQSSGSLTEVVCDKQSGEVPGTDYSTSCLQASASAAPDITDTNKTPDASWSVVVRQKKNKDSKSADSNPMQSSQSTRSGNKVKIVGTRQTDESALKTGVTIVKKAVLHIDNLHSDCTEALLKDYLLAAEIDVLTCYKAQSWLREEERSQVTAYRVCIPAAHRQKMLNPELWSAGVIIRDWKFKRSNNDGRS